MSRPRGACLSVVALGLSLGSARAQYPFVDRQPPLAPPAAHDVAPAPAPTDAVCRFIALRRVSDEMQVRLRYLQTESSYLERDATALWNGWKSAFGIQNGFSLRAVASLEQQRLQTRVFGLHGRAQRANADARELTLKFKRADESWDALTRRLVATDGGQAALNAAQADLLRARLQQLAVEVSALDERVAKGQATLNRLHPLFLDLMRREAASVVTLPQPWHWVYMLNDKPRPSLRYDFEDGYAQALEDARRDLAERARR